MAEYKTGAENVPMRAKDYNAPCPIMVFVRNLSATEDDDEIVKQLELDYGNVEDRRHLGKLTYWAITNGHSIETMSVKDANGG